MAGLAWRLRGRVAQSAERAPEKREVTGSTPVPTTEKGPLSGPFLLPQGCLPCRRPAVVPRTRPCRLRGLDALHLPAPLELGDELDGETPDAAALAVRELHVADSTTMLTAQALRRVLEGVVMDADADGKGMPLSVVVPTSVRVEAGWDRPAPSWSFANSLRIADQPLDIGAADCAAGMSARLQVSVADADLGATIAAAPVLTW